MTLVFSTSSGPLTKLQVGPADIIATISAAKSVGGWLGGLESVRFMLSKCSQFIQGDKTKEGAFEDLLNQQLNIQDTQVHILTYDYGPLQCIIPNAEDAFGGDRKTQVIGLTICALAHELGGSVAVDLFIKFLAPTMFEGAELIMDALHSQLREDDVLQRLLNEGVTRGFPDRFLESVASLQLPMGDTEWLRKAFHTDDDMIPNLSEVDMLCGLLKWIARAERDAYFTRSSLVARTASYLKAVGYNIGSIKVWDGTPPRPRLSGSKALVLVLGGSDETDHLMAEPGEASFLGIQHHYTFHTVGAMLSHAIAPYVTIRPEALQTDFESIFESIRSQLKVGYRVLEHKGNEELRATFSWSEHKMAASPIESRLAGIYLPLLVEHIAPCYRRISTEAILDQVLHSENRTAVAPFDGLTKEVARFRTTTVAIVISLVSCLSSTQFESVRHCTLLDLYSEDWLASACEIINRGFSGSMQVKEAVFLLAAIHAGTECDFKIISRVGSERIVGWRSGMYCVLPSLLLDMKPSATSVALACKDVFYANVRVHNDGSIHSSATRASLANSDYIDSHSERSDQLSMVEMIQSPWVGPARCGPPNQPLYLNIERPLHYSDPDVCFAGRVDGAVIGTVSVLDVLVAVSRSVAASSDCTHQDTDDVPTVLNVNTTTWVEGGRAKPVGTAEIPAYLAVQDDPAWALFAAGQTAYFQSCIVVGCLRCAKELVARRAARWQDDCAVLIGYKVIK